MSRAQALLATLAVLALGFFVNLIFSATSAQIDLTEDRTFTLSTGSKNIISKLDEPVTLELYVSRSDVKLRPYLESYSRRVEALLQQYVASSQGKIKLIITDPKPDTKEEQRANHYSLSGMNTPNGTAYLGLTAQQANTVKSINLLDPSREKFLEYDISKLIANTSRLEKPKLTLISTLAIANNLPQGPQQQPGPADVLLGELAQTYEIVTLSNQATELPKDTRVVMLIHPHHLSDKLAYEVDQFLMNGGNLFVAMDPLSRLQKYQQGAGPFTVVPAAAGASSDPALLRVWGVNVETSNVAADLEKCVSIRGSRGQPIQYPAAFSVGPEGLAADSPLTADLSEIAFMEAGEISLTEEARDRLKLTPLIFLKGNNTGSVSTAVANAGPFERVAAETKSDTRRRILAADVTGNFTSAFAAGTPAGITNTHHLKSSVKPGRILVVGDSDFLVDPFTVRQRELNGQSVFEEINDNLKFVLSSIETLGGHNELVTLRAKGSSLRPFKVVVALEREAQRRYQSKLDAIEKSLEETNNRINEISRRSGVANAKTLVITPEVQKEIDQFQKQAEKLVEERRAIRRGLSEEVNTLGRWLQILNLLIGPALAGLAGFIYHLVRRRPQVS